jgi:hypothetical protein
MNATALPGNKVVARFLDGRMVKGITHDFAPNKDKFHVFEGGDTTSRGTPVSPDGLKAVFFVKDYAGNRARHDVLTFEGARGQGRKIVVTFVDGETMPGFTVGYNAAATGFFLIPVDPESNNLRVFVVNKAVRSVKWA